jgi:hypothetical protein
MGTRLQIKIVGKPQLDQRAMSAKKTDWRDLDFSANGPLEEKVTRYLLLEGELEKTRRKYLDLKRELKGYKTDSRLMTTIGFIKRLQEKEGNPENFKKKEAKREEREERKRKTEAADLKSPPESSQVPTEESQSSVLEFAPLPKKTRTETSGPTAKERLVKKLRSGPPPINKEIQPAKK